MQMNTVKDTQGETILLTYAELDAVIGGKTAATGTGKRGLHDMIIVKTVDSSSPSGAGLAI
jgi:hypothetical protein